MQPITQDWGEMQLIKHIHTEHRATINFQYLESSISLSVSILQRRKSARRGFGESGDRRRVKQLGNAIHDR